MNHDSSWLWSTTWKNFYRGWQKKRNLWQTCIITMLPVAGIPRVGISYGLGVCTPRRRSTRRQKAYCISIMLLDRQKSAKLNWKRTPSRSRGHERISACIWLGSGSMWKPTTSRWNRCSQSRSSTFPSDTFRERTPYCGYAVKDVRQREASLYPSIFIIRRVQTSHSGDVASTIDFLRQELRNDSTTARTMHYCRVTGLRQSSYP